MEKKKVAVRLFNGILIILFLTTTYFLYDYLKLEYKKNIVSNKVKEEVSLLENKQEEINNLEYYKNYYLNDDVVGSLKIDGTNINTLLVQGNDNEYYLDHSIKKEYDVIGSIYVDYRTDLNSKQINIYGHNSNVYDVMFKELENYLDKEYYDTHKYIELWNGDEYVEYEIFSVQIVKSGYEHIDVNPSDWNSHINILNNSLYETGIKAQYDDDILVIQTCLYNPADSLLVINSRKV